MDVYLYTEGVRKVKGEEQVFLSPLAELEDFDSIEAALEALVDEAPELLGTEFVVFTEQPQYITVEPPPETKYSFTNRNGSVVVAEPEAEPEEDDEEPEEEPAPKPAAKRRPGTAKKPPAKKPAAKKRPAAKRPASGSKAGTRASGSKRTPFTKNPGSAE